MQLSDILVYNETLLSLSLKSNEIFRTKLIFQNIVRNLKSQLVKLNLSCNHMTMHDLADMLEILDCKETIFGERQFFKLRYIDISNNSEIKDF